MGVRSIGSSVAYSAPVTLVFLSRGKEIQLILLLVSHLPLPTLSGLFALCFA